MQAVSERSTTISDAQIEAAEAFLDTVAKARYADAPSLDADGEASWGPFVVCSCMSAEDYEFWFSSNEGYLPRLCYEPLAGHPTLGRLVVYSDRTFLHDHTTRTIMAMIERQLQDLAGGQPLEMLELRKCNYSMFQLEDRLDVPMESLTPVTLANDNDTTRHRGFDYPFPTFVLEIACKNESLRDLRAKLERWMHPATSVQVAIGLKIGGPRYAFVLVLHVRGRKTEEVKFSIGSKASVLADMGFPVGLLFAGTTMPYPLYGRDHDVIRIDLVSLRQFIAVNYKVYPDTMRI